MSRRITRAELERAVTAERERHDDLDEYSRRLWLRLAGVDPDTVTGVPPEDVIDAIALEKAREVIERRYIDPYVADADVVVAFLSEQRDTLNRKPFRMGPKWQES
jgi:predicted house-cleaning NTP pyrophosphatase (Maf/HAM1 superfamily)